jgi:hypothetical protein
LASTYILLANLNIRGILTKLHDDDDDDDDDDNDDDDDDNNNNKFC